MLQSFFLGYICQEIDAEVLTEQSNRILTAIIHGMRSTEPSIYVRLAATQALLNSLEFTKANFDKENERNFIMEVVCEATQSSDMRISVAALQCLVSIDLFFQFVMSGDSGAMVQCHHKLDDCDFDSHLWHWVLPVNRHSLTTLLYACNVVEDTRENLNNLIFRFSLVSSMYI